MPSLRSMYKDKALTTVSVKYTNGQNFLADTLAPVVPVDDRTGVYYVYGNENLLTPPNSAVTARTASPEINYTISERTYGPLTAHRLRHFIPWEEMKQARSPINPEVDATEFLTEQLAIEREIALVNAMNDTTVVTNNITLSGASQWSDNTSNPIKAIKSYVTAAKLKGLLTMNTGVMGQQVWDIISEHPAIVDRIKYTSDLPAQLGIVARLVGLEKLFIGDSVYSNGYEGVGGTNNFIWGKNFYLMKLSNTPQLKQVSAFYQLAWAGARGVYKWEQEDPEGTYIRVQDYYNLKLIAAEGVYGVYNAVA